MTGNVWIFAHKDNFLMQIIPVWSNVQKTILQMDKNASFALRTANNVKIKINVHNVVMAIFYKMVIVFFSKICKIMTKLLKLKAMKNVVCAINLKRNIAVDVKKMKCYFKIHVWANVPKALFRTKKIVTCVHTVVSNVKIIQNV